MVLNLRLGFREGVVEAGRLEMSSGKHFVLLVLLDLFLAVCHSFAVVLVAGERLVLMMMSVV